MVDIMRMKSYIGVGALVILLLMSGLSAALPTSKTSLSNNHAEQLGGGFYGYVYDAKDNTPIAGAHVVAIHLATHHVYSAITNSDGYYKIDVLLGGPFLLYASAKGYRMQVKSSFVLGPLYTRVDFYLTKTKNIQQDTIHKDINKKAGDVQPIVPVEFFSTPEQYNQKKTAFSTNHFSYS